MYRKAGVCGPSSQGETYQQSRNSELFFCTAEQRGGLAIHGRGSLQGSIFRLQLSMQEYCDSYILHTVCIYTQARGRPCHSLGLIQLWLHPFLTSDCVYMWYTYMYVYICIYVCIYRERESQNMKISYIFDTIYLPSYTLIKSTATTWRYQTHYLWYFALWMIFTFLCIL